MAHKIIKIKNNCYNFKYMFRILCVSDALELRDGTFLIHHQTDSKEIFLFLYPFWRRLKFIRFYFYDGIIKVMLTFLKVKKMFSHSSFFCFFYYCCC